MGLNNIYKGDDGSAIYTKEINGRLYGFGEHADLDYAFVFEGVVSGNRINGEWWDVPKFSRANRGKLDMQWSQSGNRIERKGGRGFGPDTWTALAPTATIPWVSNRSAGFQSTRRNDLDGRFKGNDGSWHYVREIGANVVWVAEQGANRGARPDWVTVFIGRRTSDHGISGTYADVCKGRICTESGRFGAAQKNRGGKIMREFSLRQIGLNRTKNLVPEYDVDFDKFSQRIFDAFNGNVTGFAYVITKNGSIVREHGGGWRRRPPDGSRLAFTPTTQNESASTSKLVTAAIVLRTLEEKNISLDTTVARYLPDCWEKGQRYNNRSYGLTLRQLLSHKSGIVRPSSCINNPYRCLRESVEIGCEPPFSRNYQNINFTIFRYILPRIRNSQVESVLCNPLLQNSQPSSRLLEDEANANVSERFARHVRDQVLAPLGINAGFEWTAPEFALAYDSSATSGPGLRKDTSDDYLSAGSGGMKWSAIEYGKFLAALVTGKIVSHNGLKTMKNDLLGLDSMSNRPAGLYYFKNGGSIERETRRGTESQAAILPSGIAVYVTINSRFNSYSSNGKVWILRDAFEKSIR
jgi:CubicO group peptidase (beta-lactamase class C family)